MAKVSRPVGVNSARPFVRRDTIITPTSGFACRNKHLVFANEQAIVAAVLSRETVLVPSTIVIALRTNSRTTAI